jgi:subtilase family serine protease
MQAEPGDRSAARVRHPGRRATPALGAALIMVAIVLAAWMGAPGALAAATPAGGSATAVPRFTISAGPNFTLLAAPLTTSGCQAAYGIRCYSAPQMHTAYDLNPLYRAGVTGRGETIVVAVPYGSPTIRNDLHVYDQRFGLPDPRLTIVPFGDVPPFDPANPVQVEWAAATTLQVENAHAIAPGADIVIAETTGFDFVGLDGISQLMQAEDTLVREGVGDVITQMWGSAEATFPAVSQGPDDPSIASLRYALRDAAARNVTVVSAAGDTGPAQTDLNGNLYPDPAVLWPASDPLVTSAGGVELYLDDAGRAVSPPTTWNDGYGAGSGGLSQVFPAPGYQAGLGALTQGHRALPDISMSASVNGAVWVYTSFAGVGGAGWDLFDGTDQATAQFAGIVALADQVAGHRLGLLDPALYALGYASERGDTHTGLVDITAGNNTFDGITGYPAGPGYDLATGWGTVDAAQFVPALVAASESTGSASPLQSVIVESCPGVIPGSFSIFTGKHVPVYLPAPFPRSFQA